MRGKQEEVHISQPWRSQATERRDANTSFTKSLKGLPLLVRKKEGTNMNMNTNMNKKWASNTRHEHPSFPNARDQESRLDGDT